MGEVGEVERNRAFDAARKADFFIIMFDAIQGIKKTEQELFADLTALDKPSVVVLNKIDLVKRFEAGVIRKAADSINLIPDQIIATDARNGRNIGQVILAIAKVDPEIVVALGRALPEFRHQLARSTIRRSATAAGAVGMTPLPFVDFIPLIAIQGAMILSIARIYQHKITLARAKEMAAAFGMGFMGRTLFQELSKLVGLPGDILAGVIAASTTVVMGIAAIAWFERGERLTSDVLRKLTNEVMTRVVDVLSRRGKQPKKRADLRKALKETFEDIRPEDLKQLTRSNSVEPPGKPAPVTDAAQEASGGSEMR